MIQAQRILALGFLLLAAHAMSPGAQIAAHYSQGMITEEDIDLYLSLFNGSTLRPVEYDEATGRTEAIRDIALESILSASARKEGLDQQPEIARQLALTRRSQLKKAFVEERVDVTDDEIRQYYESHPEQFRQGARVTLRHIFKEVPRTAGPEEKRQLRDEAERILQALEAGEDFGEMAERHSEVGSGKKSGGLVGPVEVEKLNEAIQGALTNLEPGQLSGVVETEHGYEILKIEQREPARHTPLESAQSSITQALRAEKYRALAQSLFASQVESPVHYDLLEDIEGNKDKTFYSVGGRKVSLGEFLDIPWAYSLEEILQRPDRAERENTVREVITDGLIEAECVRAGLDQRRDVARRIELYQNRLLAEFYLRALKMEVEPSEEGIEAYYQEHRDELKGPKRIKARLIRLPADVRSGMSPPERHYAMQRCFNQAQKIVEELRAGEDFAEYAKRHSADPSALQGGSLGWVRQGPMGYHFDMAAFEMKAGEISDPVEYELGYMIIQVEDIEPPPPLSLEEAKRIIAARLQAEQSQRLGRRRVREILQKADIRIVESP